jgi:hypothetical protein
MMEERVGMDMEASKQADPSPAPVDRSRWLRDESI